MSPALSLPAGFDPALKPTWRLLRNQVAVFCSCAANRRAERLVMRFMHRDWPEYRIEALLERLVARESAPRTERQRYRGMHS